MFLIQKEIYLYLYFWEGCVVNLVGGGGGGGRGKTQFWIVQSPALWANWLIK